MAKLGAYPSWISVLRQGSTDYRSMRSMKYRLLCVSVFIYVSYGGAAQQMSEKQGLASLGLGNNHLLQSSWAPYQNQAYFDISYTWKKSNKGIALDAGFSLSFAFNSKANQCSNCGKVMQYDADVASLRFGLGKLWRWQKFSFYLTGGGFGALSDIVMYTPIPNSSAYAREYSSRSHGGLYFRSGMDFGINQKGLRLGPFLETRISTGKTEKSLYLNVNSIILGVYIGLQRSPGNNKQQGLKERKWD